MQTPILMIHGMCCTGDVWSHFRSFFEARGATVYTPTLRPLERVGLTSKPPRALGELSLHDYVRDLELEIERIEQETGRVPAVIGHSMGGLLAQALAERNRVRAAVFISPAAPAGIHTPLTRVFWGGLLLAARFGFALPVIKPDGRTVFPMVLNAMPKHARAAALEAMVWESGRVFSEFASFPIDESKIRIPLLTIAATRDRLVAAPLVRLTGKKYASVGGDFREYKTHGHWLYAEPGWETAAQDIYAWLSGAVERSSVPALSERPQAQV
jgi:alpha-beta hydrolase superfamily lysophospholipase